MSYSRNKIKQAGKILKEKESSKPEEILWAENVLTYWRTIHGKIISDFHQIVSRQALEINFKAFIAQRLKRTPSIIGKLKRIPTIQLTTMQDIAGIRAVVNSMNELYALREALKKVIDNHLFVDEYDYINNPKLSGYRCIHLVYKYVDTPDSEFNGLLIEIQLRTKLQHAWATAVETMSAFLGTHLKFDEGQPKWLKYFALTSSAFSFLEKSNQVPKYDHLTREETFQQALYEFNYNHIEESLRGYTLAADFICNDEDIQNTYYLVELNIDTKKVMITTYHSDDLELANTKYTEREREIADNNTIQVVLVSTDSIHELRDAFPNYFLDTRDFLKNMQLIKTLYNTLKT